MGLRCSFPDDRHETGTCDRRAVALYESPADDQPRCNRHDSGEVARVAAESGYTRHQVIDGEAVARLGSDLLTDARAAILAAIATAPAADAWVDA